MPRLPQHSIVLSFILLVGITTIRANETEAAGMINDPALPPAQAPPPPDAGRPANPDPRNDQPPFRPRQDEHLHDDDALPPSEDFRRLFLADQKKKKKNKKNTQSDDEPDSEAEQPQSGKSTPPPTSAKQAKMSTPQHSPPGLTKTTAGPETWTGQGDPLSASSATGGSPASPTPSKEEKTSPPEIFVPNWVLLLLNRGADNRTNAEEKRLLKFILEGGETLYEGLKFLMEPARVDYINGYPKRNLAMDVEIALCYPSGMGDPDLVHGEDGEVRLRRRGEQESSAPVTSSSPPPPPPPTAGDHPTPPPQQHQPPDHQQPKHAAKQSPAYGRPDAKSRKPQTAPHPPLAKKLSGSTSGSDTSLDQEPDTMEARRALVQQAMQRRDRASEESDGGQGPDFWGHGKVSQHAAEASGSSKGAHYAGFRYSNSRHPASATAASTSTSRTPTQQAAPDNHSRSTSSTNSPSQQQQPPKMASDKAAKYDGFMNAPFPSWKAKKGQFQPPLPSAAVDSELAYDHYSDIPRRQMDQEFGRYSPTGYIEALMDRVTTFCNLITCVNQPYPAPPLVIQDQDTEHVLHPHHPLPNGRTFSYRGPNMKDERRFHTVFQALVYAYALLMEAPSEVMDLILDSRNGTIQEYVRLNVLIQMMTPSLEGPGMEVSRDFVRTGTLLEILTKCMAFRLKWDVRLQEFFKTEFNRARYVIYQASYLTPPNNPEWLAQLSRPHVWDPLLTAGRPSKEQFSTRQFSYTPEERDGTYAILCKNWVGIGWTDCRDRYEHEQAYLEAGYKVPVYPLVPRNRPPRSTIAEQLMNPHNRPPVREDLPTSSRPATTPSPGNPSKAPVGLSTGQPQFPSGQSGGNRPIQGPFVDTGAPSQQQHARLSTANSTPLGQPQLPSGQSGGNRLFTGPLNRAGAMRQRPASPPRAPYADVTASRGESSGQPQINNGASGGNRPFFGPPDPRGAVPRRQPASLFAQNIPCPPQEVLEAAALEQEQRERRSRSEHRDRVRQRMNHEPMQMPGNWDAQPRWEPTDCVEGNPASLYQRVPTPKPYYSPPPMGPRAKHIAFPMFQTPY